MSRSGTVGCVVVVCLISGLIGVNYVSSHPQLPQSLQAKNCGSSAPPGELPNARFARKGGRTTRNVKVWRQGSALIIDDVAQGRDLTQYERLELADPEPRVVSDQRRNPVLAQARTFLWRHWQDRKRAYLLLTLSSVDATSTISQPDTARHEGSGLFLPCTFGRAVRLKDGSLRRFLVRRFRCGVREA